MNEALEEPPTSAILLESCHFSQVIFKNVEKFYVPGADVAFHYSLTEPITPTKKDWVGIFREMQSILESLQSSREKLEQEANLLNEENQHLKAQNECKEAELHQLKEEHQNVSSDKERLENKLRATLGHMDQIQAQILNQKKEMESLARGDHDKTTQLERLKEETRLLRTALVAQPSMMKCPLCNEVFPGNVETSQYEAHVRSHLLECPYCDETFEESNKQVYEDHLFCHGLDKL
uniref:Calcium-binding and coiled-coil domain-containing protein 2 n=1 Tax=Sphenodon punctatus TaxID=8508 RepID=A0A8D0GQQ0_SPHPU